MGRISNLRSSPTWWSRNDGTISFGGQRLIDAGVGGGIDTPGQKYYVSRNVKSSGNGKSWSQAFLTPGEAVTAVNNAYSTAAYPTRGRNTTIYIDEGWYSITPMTLTANDCRIVGTAPGHHDPTVLYGTATAGGWDINSGGPVLKITGSNNTIENLGLFTYDVLYPSLRIGANPSDPDTPARSHPTGNAIINCSFVRDQADASDGGILSYGADGTLILGCFFSTSCKTYGVKAITDGEINPVNTSIIGCDFVGTPIGIIVGTTCHGTLIKDNIFRDDSSDRADTITTPVTNAGTASSTVCIGNYWAFTDANAVTGNQAMMIGNYQLAAT